MKVALSIFLIVGLGLLTGAYYSYKSTATFLDSAIATTGTVVDNVYERGSSNDSSGSYYGMIKYNALDGTDVTFKTSVGQNPPAFKVGEEVKIYYDPKDGQNARVDTFMQLWFLSVLLGGMGFIFSMIPSLFIISGLRTMRRDSWLRANGNRVSSKVVGVEIDTSMSVNGQHPYIIKSQWTNPATNQIHIFKSKRIWFDPEAYVMDKDLPVYVDRTNPAKYSVDISMLPKA